MSFDFKKITLISLITCLVIAVIFGIQHAFRTKKDQQEDSATIFEPGQFTNPSLKAVNVVFRHGNRAPMFKYKTDPNTNSFPEGLGELTKRGKQHMYKKGQLFRQLYNGFINDLYLDSELLIKTTNMKRTYMSAAMVLAGMYPPKGYQKWSDFETVWQPIPIYFDSPDHSSMFGKRGICPQYDSVFEKVFSQLKFGNNETQTRELFSYLSEKCGQPINSKNLIDLYDLFVCQIFDELQLPEWIKPYHIQTMKSILNNETSEVNSNQKLQTFLIGPLLKEISLNMELHSNNSNNNTIRKMNLYSGHDISITMIMGFLGHIIEMPEFGASLHFHLYFYETTGYTIKLFYYNRWDDRKGEEVSIPICGNPCKLQDFTKSITNNFSIEWEKECRKEES